jgi:hypothetical protein
MHGQWHTSSDGSQNRRSRTMPINRRGGSYDVSEAERLQQASLYRRAQPRLVESMV